MSKKEKKPTLILPTKVTLEATRRGQATTFIYCETYTGPDSAKTVAKTLALVQKAAKLAPIHMKGLKARGEKNKLTLRGKVATARFANMMVDEFACWANKDVSDRIAQIAKAIHDDKTLAEVLAVAQDPISPGLRAKLKEVPQAPPPAEPPVLVPED